MTPNARKKHLKALKDLCEQHGYEMDAYGNYKYPGISDFRIKFKKVNLRMERKMLGQWKALESKTWSQLDLDYFDRALLSMKKRLLKELGPEKPTKRVPLAPALEDPATVKKLNTIIDKRNHQDYQCFLILQEMMDLGMIMQVSKDTPADMQDMAGVYERATEAIDSRIDLNDQFLRTMAGA